VEPIDIESLRRQAREQLARRPTPPRTAWVGAFEDALRAALVPRAELFAAIMEAAGRPGLDDRRDPAPPAGSTRAWLIGAYDSVTLLSTYTGADGTVTTFPSTQPMFLALSPAPLSFHTTTGLPRWQSVAVTGSAPERSVITAGEIASPSAFGTVALSRYGAPAGPETDPEASAREIAAVCDRRMLLLLCAHDLTFPDRDLSGIVWDEDETSLILAAREARRVVTRPAMTVEQFVLWLDGRLGDDGLALPPLTGVELAEALARTSVPPRRRFRRNWRDKLVDAGEKGWQIAEREIERSERHIRTEAVFVRRDGTGFREIDFEVVEEFGPGHVYGPDLYAGYLMRTVTPS